VPEFRGGAILPGATVSGSLATPWPFQCCKSSQLTSCGCLDTARLDANGEQVLPRTACGLRPLQNGAKEIAGASSGSRLTSPLHPPRRMTCRAEQVAQPGFPTRTRVLGQRCARHGTGLPDLDPQPLILQAANAPHYWGRFDLASPPLSVCRVLAAP